MASMPSAVKVGSHTYSVLVKNKREMTEKGQLQDGLCLSGQLEIWIRCRMKLSYAQDTLLHEVLHACVHPSLSSKETTTEEEFITQSTPVLLGVLQDNPDLVKYLTTIG